jgi:hypothetical protein
MLQPLSNAHNNWAASDHEIFISCLRSRRDYPSLALNGHHKRAPATALDRIGMRDVCFLHNSDMPTIASKSALGCGFNWSLQHCS